MSAATPEVIALRFDHHPPATASIIEAHTEMRWRHKELALFLAGELPGSREASLALTALEECLMWANAAIARHVSAPINEVRLHGEGTTAPHMA